MYDVAIINYEMGNLFSVNSACKKVGLSSIITDNEKIILTSKSIILPGVGAFSQAMQNIKKKKLNSVLLKFIKTQRPIVGICLGMQLFFERSNELGESDGLGLIKGEVVSIGKKFFKQNKEKLNIGWSSIHFKKENNLLKNCTNQGQMYFIHSFFCNPKNKKIITSTSKINNYIFCSSIRYRNIECFQFHPEKSGIEGLKIYFSLKEKINSSQ